MEARKILRLFPFSVVSIRLRSAILTFQHLISILLEPSFACCITVSVSADFRPVITSIASLKIIYLRAHGHIRIFSCALHARVTRLKLKESISSFRRDSETFRLTLKKNLEYEDEEGEYPHIVGDEDVLLRNGNGHARTTRGETRRDALIKR